jgi:ABC-type multidrug transport system fused ATPase/permease subunit
LLPLLKPYRLVVVVIVIAGVCASLAEGLGIGLLVPLLQSGQASTEKSNNAIFTLLNELVSHFAGEQKTMAITVMMLVVILLKMGLSYLYSSLCVWLTNHIEHHYRCLVFEQFLAVSQAFLDKHPSSQLLNTLNNETKQMALAVASLLWVSINFCTLLVFSLLLLMVAWHLTLTVVIALLLVVKIVHWLTAGGRKLSQQCVAAANQLSHRTVETLTGIRTIRAFGQEDYEHKRYQESSELFYKLSVKRLLMVMLAEPLTEGLAAMVLVGFMFVTFQGALSLSVLVTVIFMLYRLQPPIKSITYNFSQITASTASISTILDFLVRENKPYTCSGAMQLAICFENVSFYYENKGQMALTQLNLAIPQGKMTAVVGASGSGKSTLINLILRFYEPTAGKIYADGLPIMGLDLQFWRGHIALVSQDIHIFNATLLENIAYGSSDVSRQDVIRAAKQAHLDEFIEQLPAGYDTVVGERGMRLSGGQRQRLAIARAIMRNPDILILDEATNALDTLSERLIQQSIETLRQNRTLIVIAHRLSTIEHADNIVVLDKGQLVEQGSLNELLAMKGYFSALYLAQQRGQAEPLQILPKSCKP